MTVPSLDIIIVNWNAGEHLFNCLASIVASEKSLFALSRVVVLDNASTDSSLDKLEQLNLPLTLICNSENRGFAASCNQGAKGSRADYLLFLNPDTRLFKDTLFKPICFMQQPQKAHLGISGVRLVDDFGSMALSCARFPTLKTFVGKMTGLSQMFPNRFPSHLMSPEECRQSAEVDQVIGAFFLVRRSLFDSLNGFDERFFMYFEEVDFALRARRKGFSSYYLADTLLYHKGAGSSGTIKAKRLFYSLRSRIQYGFKNYSFFEAVTLLVSTLTVEFAARILSAAFSLSRAKLSETVLGYSQLIASFIGQSCR
jgi:N-acetylglucosaminyl-diphospho-decaprenol L-rhamnosyltransferase